MCDYLSQHFLTSSLDAALGLALAGSHLGC